MTEPQIDEPALDERPALPVSEILRRLPPLFTVSVPSRRNSGKSYIVRQLVQQLIAAKRVDITLCMSGTSGLTKDWDFLPKGCVQPFNAEKLTRILERQRGLILEGKEVKHILVILDDCLSTKESLRSPVIQKYYTEGRHLHVSIIVISQHTSLLLTPIVRANTDCYLIGKLNKGQQEALWSSTVCLRKEDFFKLCDTVAGDGYRFLLIDNYLQTSRRPIDFLSLVKAD